MRTGRDSDAKGNQRGSPPRPHPHLAPRVRRQPLIMSSLSKKRASLQRGMSVSQSPLPDVTAVRVTRGSKLPGPQRCGTSSFTTAATVVMCLHVKHSGQPARWRRNKEKTGLFGKAGIWAKKKKKAV